MSWIREAACATASNMWRTRPRLPSTCLPCVCKSTTCSGNVSRRYLNCSTVTRLSVDDFISVLTLLQQYHDGWLKCSDDTCAHRTVFLLPCSHHRARLCLLHKTFCLLLTRYALQQRNLLCDAFRDGEQVAWGLKCPQQGCAGKMRVEYTSEQLYLQILYVKQLFDLQVDISAECLTNEACCMSNIRN